MKNKMIKFSSAMFMIAASLFVTSCSTSDDVNPPVVPTVSDVVDNINNGTLNGSLKSEDGAIQLNSNTTYQLTGSFIVEDGAEVTIPAGTNIVATAGGTDVYFAVLKGGKVNINGTNSSPVIMT